MPFPCDRESDVESDIDMPDMSELTQKKKPAKNKSAVEKEEAGTQKAVEKVAKPVVTFQKIDAAEYSQHEETIKSFLKESKDRDIHFKFPKTGTMKAQRHPTASDITVFTLPGKSFDGVDFEYPSAEFPKGFVNFTDNDGNRLKCVPYWDGKRVIYILNEKAEVRLCAHLFAGSTKGGKVRWDRGVMPLNLIPGKFSEFAVSDKVLLHKLKAQYPDMLRSYNSTFTSPAPLLPAVTSSPMKVLKLSTPKQNEEEKQQKRKLDAETEEEKPVKKAKRKLFSSDDNPVQSSPLSEKKATISKNVTGFRFTIDGAAKMVYTSDVKDSFFIEEMHGDKPGKLLFGKKKATD